MKLNINIENTERKKLDTFIIYMYCLLLSLLHIFRNK